MKPLQLTMQAFLSYEKKTEIDFSLFDGSLFLIDGETGAGKTTIFDAICFALYGDSSGGLRKADDLRSLSAPDDLETYVRFSFSAHGKIYEVERKPGQERKAKRGNKTVYQEPTALLSGGDLQHPITALRQVNKKILEILSLSKEQFVITSMIPQGKFMDLITAKSSDRSALLRDVLHTKPFADFEDALGKRANELSTRLSGESTLIDAKCREYQSDDSELSSRLVWTGDDNGRPCYFLEELLPLIEKDLAGKRERQAGLVAAQGEAHEKEKEAEAIFEKAKKDEENRAAYLKNESDLSLLLSKKEEMDRKEKENALYDKALLVVRSHRARLEAEKGLTEAKKLLERHQKSLPEAENALQKAAQENEKRNALNARNDEIVKEESALKLLSAAFESIPLLEKALKDKEESEAAARKTLDQEEKEVSSRRENASRLRKEHEGSTLQADLAALDIQKKDLDGRKKNLESLAGDHASFLKAEKEAADCRKAYLKAREEQANKSEEYQSLFQRFIDAQAGLLATALVEGSPCPVCGSLSHPSPAVPSGEVSKESLEKCKADLAEKETKAQEAASAASSAEGKAKTKEESFLRSFEEAIGKKITIDEAPYSLAEAKEANDIALSALKKNRVAVESALAKEKSDLKQAALLEKEAAEKEAALPALRSALSDAIAGLSAEKSKLQEVKKSLEGHEKEEVEACLSSLKDERERNAEEAKAIEARFRKAGSDLEVLRNDISRDETSVNEVKAKLNAAVFEDEKTLKDSGFIDVKEAEAAASREKGEVDASKEETKAYAAALLSCQKAKEEHLKAGYDKLLPLDLAALKAKLDELQAAHDRAIEETSKYSSLLSSAEGIYSALLSLFENNKATLKEFQAVNTLYLVAKGRYPRAPKVDFETYYQSAVFSSIVERASERFSSMCGGTYQLIPHDWRANIGSNTALDIDVIDALSGKSRPIRTLSGGECFKAALALALSFSDVIASSSGASEIDCLFIDEGFGTLDEESLHAVIKTVRGLTRDGTRMVGIISHVEALAADIDKKIEVRKEEGRSLLKLIA